jgi:hypothetical protein
VTKIVPFLFNELIPPVDGISDLLGAWMIVEASRINFLVTHCIHDSHQITSAIHRIGRESVPSTVQHN